MSKRFIAKDFNKFLYLNIDIVMDIFLMKFFLLVYLLLNLISGYTYGEYREQIISRLHYGGGGDWYANPSSLPNLVNFILSNTSLRPSKKIETVRLDDNKIFSYPIMYMTGHGNVKFEEDDLDVLRSYLTNGGFLFADDNYGMDLSFRREIKKLFPNKDNGLIELPFSHDIYHIYYEFPNGLPKIHEHHGGPPHGYGVYYNGRLIIFYSYNTDLGDGWEDQEVHHDPPEKRLAALKMGVNIIMYALTH